MKDIRDKSNKLAHMNPLFMTVFCLLMGAWWYLLFFALSGVYLVPFVVLTIVLLIMTAFLR